MNGDNFLVIQVKPKFYRQTLPRSPYSTKDGTFDTITDFANVYDQGITPPEEY
jgi:hypothetical protein